jgi:tRNA(fMet)-specific endonuclease VapC
VISHLLDSDWLIHWLNGVPEVQAPVREWGNRGELAVSVVTLGEVHEGLLGSADAPRKTGLLDALMVGLTTIEVRTWLVPRFAALRLFLRRTGQIIGDHDIWIAATALEYDLTLVSGDRHFERIPDLKLHR